MGGCRSGGQKCEEGGDLGEDPVVHVVVELMGQTFEEEVLSEQQQRMEEVDLYLASCSEEVQEVIEDGAGRMAIGFEREGKSPKGDRRAGH